MVECLLPKQKIAGSSPVSRSKTSSPKGKIVFEETDRLEPAVDERIGAEQQDA